ncbi:MAG: hypothetical protein IJA84_06920 [Clostridia bacterium]|nr:hypothetical protein [Clostridia bacterium]
MRFSNNQYKNLNRLNDAEDNARIREKEPGKLLEELDSRLVVQIVLAGICAVVLFFVLR